MKNYLLLLLLICVAYNTTAAHPDPRMENFDKYIKQEKKAAGQVWDSPL